MSLKTPRGRITCLTLLLCCAGLGLSPLDIALVVNSNSPESIRLANEYAAARAIPDGRIISLNLPTGDEIDFDQYERYVVPTLRQELRDRKLDAQVKCLVTFWGVPFRIRDRVDTGAEKQELADLRQQLGHLLAQAEPVAAQEESLALSLDPTFRPPPHLAGESPGQSLAQRYARATYAIAVHLAGPTTMPTEQGTISQLVRFMSILGGDADVLKFAAPKPDVNSPNMATAREELEKLKAQVKAAAADLIREQEARYDPAARASVRGLTSRFFGQVRLGEILESQIDYLTPGLTNSAFDSELALLWLGYYPRNGFTTNPLYYRVQSLARNKSLMVSRLDGPDAQTVERMIETSVQVERDGLRGCLAINSFSYPDKAGPDGRNVYQEFAVHFHTLANLTKDFGNIPVQAQYERYFQDREIGNVALYAGWYSVHHYRPGMRFAPGAVAYHFASLEAVDFHAATDTGWVRGLLKDGAVATIGPVAEPYLQAFPLPDEFFPLLMTGKLTLAEAYWRTQATASWMMCLFGDPLYNPFKQDPVLDVAHLPQTLQAALRDEPPAPGSRIPPQ